MVAIEELVNKDAIREAVTPYVDQLIDEQFTEDDLVSLMQERLRSKLGKFFGNGAMMPNGATATDASEAPTEIEAPAAKPRRSSSGTANRMPAIYVPKSWVDKSAAPNKYSVAVKQLMSFNSKQQDFLQEAARGENDFYPKVWERLGKYFKSNEAMGKFRQALADFGMSAPQSGQTEEATEAESEATEAAE